MITFFLFLQPSFFGIPIRRPVPPPLPPMPAKGQAPGNSNHLSAEPPLCQRERSTSAPNVSFNLVNLAAVGSGGLVAETLLAEQLQLHNGAHALPLGTESMRMSSSLLFTNCLQ